MNYMVYAIDINPTTFAPAKFGTIGSFVNLLVPLITLVAALLLLFMLLFGGFTFMTAGGDPEKIKKAQGIFTFAFLGFIIIVTSYLLVKVIGLITGVTTIPL